MSITPEAKILFNKQVQMPLSLREQQTMVEGYLRPTVDDIRAEDNPPLLPTDAAERKKIPLFTGAVVYFPLALIEVAKVSYRGNEQHNPGQPLHWDRAKSMDQMDTAMRHMMDSITHPLDTDGGYHLAKAAWRILAELQLHLEAQRVR